MIVYARSPRWVEGSYMGYLLKLNYAEEVIWWFCTSHDPDAYESYKNAPPGYPDAYPHIVTERAGDMISKVVSDKECEAITGLHCPVARDKLRELVEDFVMPEPPYLDPGEWPW